MAIKLYFFKDGFEEIRRSPKVVSEVYRLAEETAQSAGRGYVASGQQGKPGPAPRWNKKRGPGFQGRYRAIVYPQSWRAIWDNHRNNTLVKLMGGAGGL